LKIGDTGTTTMEKDAISTQSFKAIVRNIEKIGRIKRKYMKIFYYKRKRDLNKKGFEYCCKEGYNYVHI